MKRNTLLLSLSVATLITAASARFISANDSKTVIQAPVKASDVAAPALAPEVSAEKSKQDDSLNELDKTEDTTAAELLRDPSLNRQNTANGEPEPAPVPTPTQKIIKGGWKAL